MDGPLLTGLHSQSFSLSYGCWLCLTNRPTERRPQRRLAVVSNRVMVEPAAGPSSTGWPGGPQESSVETGDGVAEQEPLAGRAAFLAADP